MTIEAIETRYKGYRFRSRTEARWAVFLDALKVPYAYEKEGLVTAAGPYLPDFTLYPDDERRECLLEIKPSGHTEIDQRWKEIALEGNRSIYVGRGAPWDRDLVVVWALDPKDTGSPQVGPFDGTTPAAFARCPICQSWLPAEHGMLLHAYCSADCDIVRERMSTIRRSLVVELNLYLIGIETLAETNTEHMKMWPEYANAEHAAKSARFEHGESGPG